MNEDQEAIMAADITQDTKHQVATVVLGAIAGYVAGRLVSAAYVTAAVKFRTFRANKSE